MNNINLLVENSTEITFIVLHDLLAFERRNVADYRVGFRKLIFVNIRR